MGLKQYMKKAKNLKQLSINNMIYRNYYEKEIDERLVYVESRDGKDFTGNILRIVEELSTGDYGDFKIVVYAKKDVVPKIRKLEKNYSLNISEIISKESVATQKLEIAKYIISDSGMRPKYVKRPGQIVMNTWHGTPLKTMGVFNQAEEHRCGNIQQEFFACDYLLYPNDYMKEKMLTGYMMEKIYPGTILLEGYPRNSVFFKREEGVKLKEKLGYADKQIFVYMPTFKGKMLDRKDEEQKDEIDMYLHEIDAKLNQNQVLLVKLHVFNQQNIDFSDFEHIQPFPEGYEIYDVLNMAECLITDYSSVFFDFANTRRKIIIFNYDEDEYMKDRGTFFPISDLPFPKVQTVSDLIDEMNRPKDYDDAEFVEKFCTYDNPDAVERLCRHVFKNEKVCREEKIENDKKNVLIFAGGLNNNGITSSLLNVLNNIDREKYNIFVCYRTWDSSIRRGHVEMFKRFPEGVEFTPLRSRINPTVQEHQALKKLLDGSVSDMQDIVKEMFERELKRSFYNFTFDAIIHFNGYGINELLLFSQADSKKSVWVHNDMIKELETKTNQNRHVLEYVYRQYDTVSVVSPDLIKPTSELDGNPQNIKVVHNYIDYREITRKSGEDIVIGEGTEVVKFSDDSIEEILEKPGKKFITIGRFSPEKGHKRLISAFDKFCDDYPDSKLIIIGGYGTYYGATVGFAENAKHSKNIVLINSIANPMPIVKACDLYVVSSFYEGWPMVIMEADVLKLPVVATSITGTQWMNQFSGYLVDNSEEAILQGMYDYMDGKITDTLDIDYEEYNRNAINEFLDVM